VGDHADDGFEDDDPQVEDDADDERPIHAARGGGRVIVVMAVAVMTMGMGRGMVVGHGRALTRSDAKPRMNA
jgi:hypothetical protein